jgi:hypothetical protein
VAISTTIWDPNRGNVNTMDGVPIGQSTPAAGSFTTLSATGAVSLAGGAISQQASSVTASTTHTIVGATALTPISLVNAANANDAVKLPVATAGLTYTVITVGSTATPNVYPGQSADTIDGGSAGASVTLTAAHRGATFYCAVAGNWVSSLFGAVAA